MIKNRLKLSLAAAMVTATCGFAGTVTAPNSVDIELSGDVELKAISEKTNTQKIDKRTAEVNLALESKLKNGTKIITKFTAYDDTQAKAGAETGLTTKEAYANIPIMNGKGKIIAGLAPNITYGTDAFDNGDESWKVAVNVPVAKGVKVTVVSKIKNEEETDSNKGDSGATAIRVDAKVGKLMIGAKYGSGYNNKGDGKIVVAGALDPDNTETKAKTITGYVVGKVVGLNIGAEYVQKDVDLIGANKTIKPKGYFLTVGKSFGNLTASVAYVNLSKGLQGGDDFAPGMILDGIVNSSATKDTSAIVLPIKFKINEKVTTNLTLIKADVLEESAKEIDLGLTYAMDESIEIKAGVGKYTHTDSANDQTNIEVAIAIKF